MSIPKIVPISKKKIKIALSYINNNLHKGDKAILEKELNITRPTLNSYLSIQNKRFNKNRVKSINHIIEYLNKRNDELNAHYKQFEELANKLNG